jgi:hypothetical protein
VSYVTRIKRKKVRETDKERKRRTKGKKKKITKNDSFMEGKCMKLKFSLLDKYFPRVTMII